MRLNILIELPAAIQYGCLRPVSGLMSTARLTPSHVYTQWLLLIVNSFTVAGAALELL